MSVRNSLKGVVTSASVDDVEDSDLIAIDIGGVLIMARVTKAATLELGLPPVGKAVWALAKTVSLRPHVYLTAVPKMQDGHDMVICREDQPPP